MADTDASSARRISVLDYGVGNIASVLNMAKRVGVAAERITSVDALQQAEALILPGVGAFDYCMEQLEAAGVVPTLRAIIEQQRIPVLGICVGFQMLFSGSEEGVRPGLGVLPGRVVRFRPQFLSARQKIPHMGWSDITVTQNHPLFHGITQPRFYFVHSYHAAEVPEDLVQARCEYGQTFPCAVARGRLAGVQFHPEKSHRYGMQLLRNFAQWEGAA